MSKIDLLEWTTLSDFNAAMRTVEEKAREAAASIYAAYKKRNCSGSFVRSANHTISHLQSLKHRVNRAAERLRQAKQIGAVPAFYSGDPHLCTTYSTISDDAIWYCSASISVDGETAMLVSVDTEYEEYRGRWVSRALVARWIDGELQFRWLSVCDKLPFKLP